MNHKVFAFGVDEKPLAIMVPAWQRSMALIGKDGAAGGKLRWTYEKPHLHRQSPQHPRPTLMWSG